MHRWSKGLAVCSITLLLTLVPTCSGVDLRHRRHHVVPLEHVEVPDDYVLPLIDHDGGDPNKKETLTSFSTLLTKQPSAATPAPTGEESDLSLYDNDIDSPQDPNALANKAIIPVQSEISQLKEVLKQGKLLSKALPEKQKRYELLESKLESLEKQDRKKQAIAQMEKQKTLLDDIKKKGGELEGKLKDLKDTEAQLLDSVKKAKAAISKSPHFTDRQLSQALSLDTSFLDSSSQSAGPGDTTTDSAHSQAVDIFNAGECPIYSASPVPTQIEGNNEVVYNVIKIDESHLVEPSVVDNTIPLSTACAFSRMAEAAKAAGVILKISSGFRTRQPKAGTGNLAAIPGSSNHDRGSALDLNTNCGGQTVQQLTAPSKCFQAPNKVYQWLFDHAQDYNFIRTVQNEPWHWEYKAGITERAEYS